MIRTLSLFAAALICLTIFITTSAKSENFNGNELHALCISKPNTWEKGFCDGYIMGVFEGMEMMKLKGSPVALCIPKNVTSKHILDVVYQYIKNGRAEWHLGGAHLVNRAINKAWACHKR